MEGTVRGFPHASGELSAATNTLASRKFAAPRAHLLPSNNEAIKLNGCTGAVGFCTMKYGVMH